jgi:ABC-type proline/glycine betaine transport system substrate-binding protein
MIRKQYPMRSVTKKEYDDFLRMYPFALQTKALSKQDPPVLMHSEVPQIDEVGEGRMVATKTLENEADTQYQIVKHPKWADSEPELSRELEQMDWENRAYERHFIKQNQAIMEQAETIRKLQEGNP